MEARPISDALKRLAQVLDSSAAEENEYRHEIDGIRNRSRNLVDLLQGIPLETSPSSLGTSADGLAKAIGSYRGDLAALDGPLNEFTTQVAIARALATSAIEGTDSGVLTKELADAVDSAKRSSNELDRLLGGARRLVGNAAEDRLAADYRTKADENKTDADNWRIWTIVGLIFTLMLSATTTGLAIFAHKGLVGVFSTGGLSLATAGFTGFLASQAKLHRERETTYRNAELRMAIIGPLIDSIEPTARDDVRADVVKLLFGNSPDPSGPIPKPG